MWIQSGLLVWLHIVLVVLAQDKPSQDHAPEKETPSPQEEDDLGETMRGLGWCKEDREVAALCIACAQLPGVLALPPGQCCTEEEALIICKSCVEDPLSCLQDETDIAQDKREGSLLDEEQTSPAVDKRYGMLFLGEKPIFLNNYPQAEKRFGTLNMGSPREKSASDLEGDEERKKRWGSLGLSKRYGTLNMGSYLRKRYGMLGLGYLGRWYGNMGKRFGTLQIGAGRYRFDKRYGRLYMDKKWGTLNMAKKRSAMFDAELAKSYGKLNLGKRYGPLNLGSGNGEPTLGKRYGTLNMGNSYGYFPYKRREYVPYNGNIGIDVKKRYGRLFMGRFGGKRLGSGSGNEIQISEIKK